MALHLTFTCTILGIISVRVEEGRGEGKGGGGRKGVEGRFSHHILVENTARFDQLEGYLYTLTNYTNLYYSVSKQNLGESVAFQFSQQQHQTSFTLQIHEVCKKIQGKDVGVSVSGKILNYLYKTRMTVWLAITKPTSKNKGSNPGEGRQNDTGPIILQS